MSSLRMEIEQTMGLKFPERNGEAIVRFEESMEIPRSAENLMRGFYKDPDQVRESFKNLHQETGSILDILLPRRSRLREWAEELPDQPLEAEKFLKETSEELLSKEQRIFTLEQDLMKELKESGLQEIFPIPLDAFGAFSYKDPSVKIYLRPLGRLAEILQLNPDQLRQVVRLHFLFLLLLISGLDLDERNYIRGEEAGIQLIVQIYTTRYIKQNSSYLMGCYLEWLRSWGGKNHYQDMLKEGEAEKLRAAMIFWRRQTNLNWEECWNLANKFEQSGIKIRERREPFERPFFD